jgi:hypothetical protein
MLAKYQINIAQFKNSQKRQEDKVKYLARILADEVASLRRFAQKYTPSVDFCIDTQ